MLNFDEFMELSALNGERWKGWWGSGVRRRKKKHGEKQKDAVPCVPTCFMEIYAPFSDLREVLMYAKLCRNLAEHFSTVRE